MSRPELEGQLEATRARIVALGEEFAAAVPPLLRESLGRRAEQVVVDRAEWFNRLDGSTAGALRRSVRDAIARAADHMEERLRAPDLWLQPTIELARPPEPGLAQPNHRVWVTLLSAADALDPVMGEFGLAPSDLPDPGGGHFGLQPQSAGDLDPRGVLQRLWRRYVALNGKYRELLARIPEAEREAARDQARRRWRAGS